jgi:hypothetical protein
VWKCRVAAKYNPKESHPIFLELARNVRQVSPRVLINRLDPEIRLPPSNGVAQVYTNAARHPRASVPVRPYQPSTT